MLQMPVITKVKVLNDKVSINYHLRKPYGYPDVKGIVDIPFESIDKLAEPPQEVGLGINSIHRIPIHPLDRTLVFIVDSFTDLDHGPNEQVLYGPYLIK